MMTNILFNQQYRCLMIKNSLWTPSLVNIVIPFVCFCARFPCQPVTFLIVFIFILFAVLLTNSYQTFFFLFLLLTNWSNIYIWMRVIMSGHIDTCDLFFMYVIFKNNSLLLLEMSCVYSSNTIHRFLVFIMSDFSWIRKAS